MAQGQYLSLPAAAAGLAPASGGTAWTYGSYVEATSSTSTGIYITGIQLEVETNPAAADATNEILIEVATGASSSEVTKLQVPFDYRADTITSANNGLGYWMPRILTQFFPEPYFVPLGTRIAVRATDQKAGAVTYRVKLLYREGQPPTVALNSPADASSTSDTTPTFDFTGTDVDRDDIRYRIQIHTDNTFKPTAPTNILQEINNTDQASVTTSSFTRVEGRLYMLSVNSKTEITADPSQPTASGTGLSFTVVPTNGSEIIDNSSSSRRRLTLLYAVATSSGTGTITVSFGGQTQVTTGIILDEIESGFDLANPIVQAAKNNSQTAVTSITATLATFSNTDNITYGVFGVSNGTTNPTAGSGFTSLGQARDGTEGNLGLETMYKLANDTTVDWTFSSDSELGVIGVEIKAKSLIDRVSGTDAGFANPDNGGDTDPFTSGENIQYTVQAQTTIDSYSESNRNYQNALYSGSLTKAGQSITGNGRYVGKASFYLQKVGSPTGNIVAEIYAHTGTFGSGGTATGSALVTSSSVDVSTIGTSWALVDFSFPIPLYLTNTTKYCVVISYSGGDSSNKVEYGFDDSSPSHAGNLVEYNGSWAGWSSTDLCFYLYSKDETLALDTYYWRVIATDPTGSNTYGAWATARSLTVNSDTITTQTILGKARVSVTTSQTILGKSRVTAITSQTITGKSRISKTVSATIQGLARITSTTLQTLLGKARVEAITTQTIAGRARITQTVSQTITGISRITTSTLQTILGKARIEALTTRTITGISRITATANQTISGLARVTATATATILGKSRITAPVLQAIQGLARITATSTATLLGKSRITATTDRTLSGKSRIEIITTQTIDGKSRITALSLQTIQGKSKISVLTSQTLTGKARIDAQILANLLGKSRISQTVDQTIQGRGSVANLLLQTITGKSSILNSTTQNILGKAKIKKVRWYNIPVVNWFNEIEGDWKTKNDNAWNTRNSQDWYLKALTDWHEDQ